MPVIVGSGGTGSEGKSDRMGLPTGTSDPGSAAAGDMYYKTDTNKIRIYDGNSWGDLSSGASTYTSGAASGFEYSADVVKAGVKYVSGDLTFNVGVASGDSKDNTIGSISGSDDSKDVTSASVSYAVAAGVTAILGYTTVEASDEGASSTDGSAWYIGANMSF